MPQQQLDYRSRLTDRRGISRAKMSAMIVASVVILANGVLLAMAAFDRSWFAFGIMMGIGPITNGVILLLLLGCTPIVKARSAGASIEPYLVSSIGLPLAAIVADYIIISNMGLHGC